MRHICSYKNRAVDDESRFVLVNVDLVDATVGRRMMNEHVPVCKTRRTFNAVLGESLAAPHGGGFRNNSFSAVSRRSTNATADRTNDRPTRGNEATTSESSASRRRPHETWRSADKPFDVKGLFNCARTSRRAAPLRGSSHRSPESARTICECDINCYRIL